MSISNYLWQILKIWKKSLIYQDVQYEAFIQYGHTVSWKEENVSLSLSNLYFTLFTKLYVATLKRTPN